MSRTSLVATKNWNEPVKWNRFAANKSCGFCSFEESDGELLKQCRRCAKKPRVFPSLCDWLDDEVPIEWLARFLGLIRETPNLDWLLLTKRPELWDPRIRAAIQYNEECRMGGRNEWLSRWLSGTPPNNVWIGTSVKDQTRADERIPEFLRIPAKLRFLSVEPMLGPVDLDYSCFNGSDSFGSMPGIHWVIVGGESGPGARPCNVAWIRDIVRQCRSAGVPCFVKQLGAVAFEGRFAGKADPASFDRCERLNLRHPKGGDPSEWPEDLRVRQMPEVKL